MNDAGGSSWRSIDRKTRSRLDRSLRQGQPVEDPADVDLLLQRAAHWRRALRRQRLSLALIALSAGIGSAVGLIAGPFLLAIVAGTGVLVAAVAFLQQGVIRGRIAQAEERSRRVRDGQ